MRPHFAFIIGQHCPVIDADVSHTLGYEGIDKRSWSGQLDPCTMAPIPDGPGKAGPDGSLLGTQQTSDRLPLQLMLPQHSFCVVALI